MNNSAPRYAGRITKESMMPNYKIKSEVTVTYIHDVTDAVRGAEDRFAHSPNNCPSNHWNRGDDICEDCGLNLNE